MWKDQTPYATFKYNDDGTLNPRPLVFKDLMEDFEWRGILNQKQFDELYSLPHTYESPATMDVVHQKSGNTYRVIRSDFLRVRFFDGEETMVIPHRRAYSQVFSDIDRQYEWSFSYTNPANSEWRQAFPAALPTDCYVKGADPIGSYLGFADPSTGGIIGTTDDGHDIYDYLVCWDRAGYSGGAQAMSLSTPIGLFITPRPLPISDVDFSQPIPVPPAAMAAHQCTISSSKGATKTSANKKKISVPKAYKPKKSEDEALDDLLEYGTELMFLAGQEPPELRGSCYYRVCGAFGTFEDFLGPGKPFDRKEYMKSHKSKLQIVFAPQKHWNAMYALGLFDGLKHTLLVSGASKTTMKDLRAHGYDIVYFWGESQQGTPALSDYYVPKASTAVYSGTVSPEIFASWAFEKISFALFEALKESKYIVHATNDTSFVCEAIDLFTCGKKSVIASSYAAVAGSVGDNVDNVLYYYANSYGAMSYGFVELAQADPVDVADVEEACRVIRESVKTWKDMLIANKKKSAFNKLADFPDGANEYDSPHPQKALIQHKAELVQLGVDCGIEKAVTAL